MDILGKRFGLLVVVSRDKVTEKLYCKCDCGNTKTISQNNLYKKTRSCGCLQKAYAKARCLVDYDRGIIHRVRKRPSRTSKAIEYMLTEMTKIAGQQDPHIYTELINRTTEKFKLSRTTVSIQCYKLIRKREIKNAQRPQHR